MSREICVHCGKCFAVTTDGSKLCRDCATTLGHEQQECVSCKSHFAVENGLYPICTQQVAQEIKVMKMFGTGVSGHEGEKLKLRKHSKLHTTPNLSVRYNPDKALHDMERDLAYELISDELQRKFETGAVRDSAKGKGRYDLLPWHAIHELSQHCERGAIKYGERNVDKGIPQSSMIDSAIRHLSCYLRGMDDEPHLVSALWNIAWMIEHQHTHPEMNNLPREGDKNEK